MTKPLIAKEVAEKIKESIPDSIIDYTGDTVLIKGESVFNVCTFLNKTAGLDFDYLVNLTAVDYTDYFEVVYHLASLTQNHSMVLKTRCYSRNQPVLASVTPIWRGADLQEREVYDLLGIRFEGHYNMKRIVLWEGFPGHPLRRDYL